MSEKYFQGVKQDNKLKKVMDFFSEHVCGNPKPERFIQNNGFKNTKEIESRKNRIKLEIIEKKEQKEFMFNSESRVKRNDSFVETAKHLGIFTLVAPLSTSISILSNELQTTAMIGVGVSAAFVAVHAIKTTGYSIQNKYEEIITEKRSGVKKRHLEKDIQKLDKEKEKTTILSEILKHSINIDKFDTVKTMKKRKMNSNNSNSSGSNKNSRLKESLNNRLKARQSLPSKKIV